jgi:hypothetical protein
MSGEMLKVSVMGADSLKSFFKRMPESVKPIAITEVTAYFVGNPSHGLKHYPPWRGQKYVRTYNLQNGWVYRIVSPARGIISTSVPYAIYPQGQPPAHNMLKWGWRGHMDVIESNMKGAIMRAQQAVIKWIKAAMA